MSKEKIEWYLDFIDLSYKPSKTDLIATFYVEPAEGISIEEAAGRVASESSVGTWTTLWKLPERVKRIMARVFEIKGNIIKFGRIKPKGVDITVKLRVEHNE